MTDTFWFGLTCDPEFDLGADVGDGPAVMLRQGNLQVYLTASLVKMLAGKLLAGAYPKTPANVLPAIEVKTEEP